MKDHMYNKNYLSKRPFLVITTSFLPGPQAKTSMKNWSENSGWNVAEEVVIVDRVKNKHLTYATLILDVLEDKIVKNSFRDADPQTVRTHYMNKYKNQLQQALTIWADNEAKRIAIEQYTSEKEVEPVVATEVLDAPSA